MRISILMVALFALSLAACNSKPKQAEENSVDVTGLLAVIDQNIDQEIYIVGTVNHVCSHSGRRCFLIDSTGEYSIRVEAGGEIEKISKELIGNTIKVKGFVKEERVTLAQIEDMEVEALEKHPEDTEANGENAYRF